jgi:hypothetical protein
MKPYEASACHLSGHSSITSAHYKNEINAISISLLSLKTGSLRINVKPATSGKSRKLAQALPQHRARHQSAPVKTAQVGHASGPEKHGRRQQTIFNRDIGPVR